jgi:hypothetical protein
MKVPITGTRRGLIWQPPAGSAERSKARQQTGGRCRSPAWTLRPEAQDDGPVTAAGSALTAFGAFWAWKALLSRVTTTGVANQFLQGFPTPRAKGATSHAAGQRAAAYPCLVVAVALLLPGLLLLAGLSNGWLIESGAAVYLVGVQVAGFLWAKHRADRASEVTAAAQPDEPARY